MSKRVSIPPPGFDELSVEERVDEQQRVLPSGIAHGTRRIDSVPGL